MNWHNFSHYLILGFDWIILPGIVVNLYLSHRAQKKTSTKLMFIGVFLSVFGTLSTPFHQIYIVGTVLIMAGLVMAIYGGFLYWRNDYVKPVKNLTHHSSGTPNGAP